MAKELCDGCDVLRQVNKLLPFEDAMCKRLMFHLVLKTPVEQIRAALDYKDEVEGISLEDALLLLEPYKGRCRFNDGE